MKRILSALLCAVLLAGCQPIVPAEESSVPAAEPSQASSALSSEESAETSSFPPEELETAQQQAFAQTATGQALEKTAVPLA